MNNTEALRAAAQQALVALVHHTEQTRPIQRTADAIAALRAAVAQQPAASGVPVAWHMRVIGCDGSADWCELGATPPEPVDGVEALPLVYATAPPAPARVPLTHKQIKAIWMQHPEMGDPGHVIVSFARAIEAAHGIPAPDARPNAQAHRTDTAR